MRGHYWIVLIASAVYVLAGLAVLAWLYVGRMIGARDVDIYISDTYFFQARAAEAMPILVFVTVLYAATVACVFAHGLFSRDPRI
ncbi:MAG: hypothetical protein ACREJB_10300 [Planctomycetaceae bacterium]